MRFVVIALLLAGCSSGSGDEGASDCGPGVEAAPLTRTCYPEPLPAVTDEASVDYGRLPCVVLDAGRAETTFCACTQPGYRPVTATQNALAREHLAAQNACRGSCCDDLCFCELLQFSGDDLAYCQDRAGEPATEAPVGWCYIEPGAGFGDESRIDECPPSQPHLVRFLPDDFVVNRLAVFACRS
jgi:hypothetical protein